MIASMTEPVKWPYLTLGLNDVYRLRQGQTRATWG